MPTFCVPYLESEPESDGEIPSTIEEVSEEDSTANRSLTPSPMTQILQKMEHLKATTFAHEFDTINLSPFIEQWAEAVAQFVPLLPEWRVKVLALTPAETFTTFKDVILWAGIIRESRKLLGITKPKDDYCPDFIVALEVSRDKMKKFIGNLEELAKETSKFLDEWRRESSEEIKEEWQELADEYGLEEFGDIDSVVLDARLKYGVGSQLINHMPYMSFM